MKMFLDMTAELAPFLWGMIGLLFLSAVAIAAAALPTQRNRQPATPETARQRQVPRQILSPGMARVHSPASARS